MYMGNDRKWICLNNLRMKAAFYTSLWSQGNSAISGFMQPLGKALKAAKKLMVIFGKNNWADFSYYAIQTQKLLSLEKAAK